MDVFVNRIPKHVTQNQLSECFQQFGAVEATKIVESATLTNYGFIRFADSDGAKAAIASAVVPVRGYHVHVKPKFTKFHRQDSSMASPFTCHEITCKDDKWCCPDPGCSNINMLTADKCCRCSLNRTTFNNQQMLQQKVSSAATPSPTPSQALKAKAKSRNLIINQLEAMTSNKRDNNNVSIMSAAGDAPKRQTDGEDNLVGELRKIAGLKKSIADLDAKRKQKGPAAGDPYASDVLEMAGECLKRVHDIFTDGAFNRRMSGVNQAFNFYHTCQEMLETSVGDNVSQHMRDAVNGAARALHLKFHDYLDNYPVDRVFRLSEQLYVVEAAIRDNFAGVAGEKVAPFGPDDPVDGLMKSIAGVRSSIAANKQSSLAGKIRPNGAEEERKRCQDERRKLADSLRAALDNVMRICGVADEGEESGKPARCGVPDAAKIVGDIRSSLEAEHGCLLRLEKAASAFVECNRDAAVAAKAVVALCQANELLNFEIQKLKINYNRAVELSEEKNLDMMTGDPMAKVGLGQKPGPKRALRRPVEDAEGDKPAALDSMVAARSTPKTDVASLEKEFDDGLSDILFPDDEDY